MKTVGIIGYGFVGKALGQIALKDRIRVVPYDPNNTRFSGPENMLAALNSDFVFVCVPTPPDEDGTLNVSVVVETAEKWKELCTNKESILIVKSTIPPGCIDEIQDYIKSDRLVFNPEFFTQRTSKEDFVYADEVIVGGPNEQCCQAVLDLYRAYYETISDKTFKERRYIKCDAKTAELAKIARNSFYATKVAFMNELFELCDKMKVDFGNFRDVFAYQGRNSWVERQHTQVPGPDGNLGFGGKCLPKDALGLIEIARDYKVPMTVLEAASESNKQRRPEAYGIDSSNQL